MESENKTVNYRCYEKDKIDKDRRNFPAFVEQHINFYNGKQYNTENLTNDIRTTLNICQMMVNTKASNIVGTPRFFTFMNSSGTFDSSKLEKFDEYNRKKLNDNIEDYESAKKGYIVGTEIFFYRWDLNDTSYKGIYKGGLVGEHIDPRAFAVSDPSQLDIQNQKWVMFWKQEELEAVLELVEGKNKKEIEEKKAQIVPDNYENNKELYDREPTAMTYELVTVYTRFFRVNGEVFFMASTKNVDLYEYPHALNPRLNVAISKTIQEKYEKALENEDKKDFVDYEMDFSDIVAQSTDRNKLNDSEYMRIKDKFSLYPFAKFTPLPLSNSFYGKSDLSSIIPTQKSINFAISMNLKCIENAAYSKVLVKEGALAGQEITNEPGQVITDYTKNVNGWGIKFEQQPQVPNGLLAEAKNLIDLTRLVNNFNDVMDGSVSNQDISGYALQLMMKQSKTSLEQQQQIFWKFDKDKATIRLMFYKHFVDKAKFIEQYDDITKESQELAQRKLQDKAMRNGGQLQETGVPLSELENPIGDYKVEEFNGEELRGVDFDVDLNVEVMQGLVDSKISEAQVWDTLIRNGGIANLSTDMLELYMRANPAISQRSKAILKKTVDEQKRTELYQTKQALQQAIAQIQSLMKYETDLKGQLDYLTNYNKNLTNEFTNKINVANQINKSQRGLIDQMVNTNKSQGEVKSNNALGIEGTSFVNNQ